MYILHVVPIARGIHAETLTYFSVKYVAPGNLVRVKYNHRDLIALTAKVEMVRDLKADVKELYFQIKNISEVITDYTLPESSIHAGSIIAERYRYPLHAVISQLIPKSYLEFLEDTFSSSSPQKSSSSLSPAIEKEPLTLSRASVTVLQASTSERYERYKTIAREYLSRDESVLIVAPTTHEATLLYHSIAKGVDNRVLVLHGAMTKKKIYTLYAQLMSSNHSLIIISTPLFVASAVVRAPRLCIIENESSDAYLSNKEPYLHMKEYVCLLAEHAQIPLLLASSLPSFDLLARIEHGTVESFQEPRTKFATDAQLFVHERSALPKKTTWELFLPETLAHIHRTRQTHQVIFFFIPKKGYASFIACRDCQTVVTCPLCAHNLTLHNNPSGTGRILRCHYCKSTHPAQDMCSHCGGHRLQLLGVTVERVEEELRQLFPHVSIRCIDALRTTTEKQLQSTIQQWHDEKGFLIGTQRALDHIPSHEHVIIPSLDSLLARPEYDTEERIMRLIIDLVEKTKYSFTIQAQDAHNPLIADIHNKSISEYIRREIKLRETFHYPPFTQLIYLHFPYATLQTVQSATTPIEHQLLSYAPYFIERGVGSRIPGVFLVLKVPLNEWQQYCLRDDQSLLLRFLGELSLPVQIFTGFGV